MTFPAGIGPHNGRELELMLSGRKPLAIFSAEPGMAPEHVGDSGFARHVERGEILFFSWVEPHFGIEWRAYCLPTEEWRAKLCLLLWKMDSDGTRRDVFTPADLSRLHGTLLGYSKEDIELFIARLVERGLPTT